MVLQSNQHVLLPLAKVIIYKHEIFMSLLYVVHSNDKFSLAYFEAENEKTESLFCLLSLGTWPKSDFARPCALHCTHISSVTHKEKCGICRN